VHFRAVLSNVLKKLSSDRNLSNGTLQAQHRFRFCFLSLGTTPLSLYCATQFLKKLWDDDIVINPVVEILVSFHISGKDCCPKDVLANWVWCERWSYQSYKYCTHAEHLRFLQVSYLAKSSYLEDCRRIRHFRITRCGMERSRHEAGLKDSAPKGPKLLFRRPQAMWYALVALGGCRNWRLARMLRCCLKLIN